MGIKVIMIRCDSSGVKPAERLFEDGDNWFFAYDRNISTLHIISYTKPDADGNFQRNSIAEFPSSGIESVEFA